MNTWIIFLPYSTAIKIIPTPHMLRCIYGHSRVVCALSNTALYKVCLGMSVSSSVIAVRGAREHNLKNVDIDVPRGTLTVFTGLSGSGKSSLAFDTIYAEGQRRYVESLSAYARQFLEQMQKPDVDSIEGLSPAIAIEQKTSSRNPRSTVGTVTEIYDYMRLLWARAGIPHSPATGLPIESQTTSQIVDRLLAMPQGTRLYLLAPIVRERKGEHKKELEILRKKGFERVQINGTVHEIANAPELDRKKKHNIDVVIDRVVIDPDDATRIADSVETALKESDGLVCAAFVDVNPTTGTLPEPILFSARFACPVSGFSMPEISPRLFSFNAPQGACPACDGLGTQKAIDPLLVVPNEMLCIEDGAVVPWANKMSPLYAQTLRGVAEHYKGTSKLPWRELSAEAQKALLYGTGEEAISFQYSEGLRRQTVCKPFQGIIPYLEQQLANGISDVAEYASARSCEACHGHRLRPEALCVKVGGKHIGEITSLSIRQAAHWFATLNDHLSSQQRDIAARVLKEIGDRLSFLNNVGLEYLTLARGAATLSGGESQRIRLASQIGSGLTGVLYVLDEPSIGLHQRDNTRLLETLRHLRDLGNTVVVVEHDEEAILCADYVFDIGPGAGVHGGHVVAQGTPQQVMDNPNSLTGAYLSGKRAIEVPAKRRDTRKSKKLRVVNARGNNLQGVTGAIPVGAFTCITGVSGSGKSTFTLQTLFKAAARRLNGTTTAPAPHDHIEGLEFFDKVIDIDQSPIGRTPRSNPATYTGAFALIRDRFAELPEAKARGYRSGRFSFNVKGGRCEACQGDGVIKIEMHFLPDVYVTCEHCKGQRYNRETLEVTYRGKSIADVLDMTVRQAADFFVGVPLITEKLETLDRVGLGYIRVGQQATTLSGGEAQRIKLAKELSRRATGRTLYILDEPTTGLHFEDVRKLIELLQELTDQGNTVVVIEHNLDVIKTADYLLDFGPEGGSGGGQLVCSGTPEEVAANSASHTGIYLKELLERPRQYGV